MSNNIDDSDVRNIENNEGEIVGKEIVKDDHISLRAWCTIFTVFTVDALSLGARSLFLVMILQLETDLNWNRENLGGLIAVVHIFNGFFTPIAGHLIDKYFKGREQIIMSFALFYLALCFCCTALLTSSWQVWFVYGFMSGSAYGLLNLNTFSVAIIRAVPENKIGFAVGVGTSGSTAGQLALVPLFSYLNKTYGWRQCYFALAVSAFMLIIPTLIFIKQPTVPVNTESDIETEITEKLSHEKSNDNVVESSQTAQAEGDKMLTSIVSLFCIPQYWVLIGVFVACGVTTTGFIETHFIALQIQRGENDASIAALAFSLLCATNGLSMVITGYLVDVLNRHYLLAGIFFIRGLCYVLLLLPIQHLGDNRIILFIFSAFFGFVDYSVVPPIVSLVKSLAGDSLVGLGVGILLLFHSFGAAAGSSIGGFVFHSTGNYSIALYLCLSLCVTAAIACASMSFDAFVQGQKKYEGLVATS